MEYYNSCCSFTKLRMTLWDPMDCSTPGFPALHYLLSFELEMPSNLLILCHLLLLPSVFPSFGSFPMSRLFASGSQSIGASASASDFPKNIQD